MTRLQKCTGRLSDEKGFGLVEALIALTILVIGLVAVSGLTMASSDQAIPAVIAWPNEDENASPSRAAEPAFHLAGNGKPRILHEHFRGKPNLGSAALKLPHLGCGHDLQPFPLLLKL